MLPKLSHPVVEITIPSTKEKKNFRPFTVEEEKIMLIAAEDKSEKSSISAIKQIINNCCVDSIKPDLLTSFDLEYIFVKLRAVSVSNILMLVGPEKKQVAINLDDMDIQYPKENLSNKIIVDEKEGIGVVLKYPTLKDIEKYSDSEDKLDSIKMVLENIFDKNQVYNPEEYSSEELTNWLGGIVLSKKNEIQKWIENIPYVYIDINFPDGTKDRLTGIKDFFVS